MANLEITLLQEELIEPSFLNKLRIRIKKLLSSHVAFKTRTVSLVFCDDATIRELNAKYLGRNWPTNVLSFLIEDKSFLGEIIISVSRAREESEFYGLNFENYLLALIVHGLVHLLGHDHEKGWYAPWLMLKTELKFFEKVAFRQGKEAVIKFLRRREYMPAKLAVNVDHVATVREARKAPYPDPVAAAVMVELGGADGVVVHLRLDRRHIKERDVRLIKEVIKTKLILEMAISEEFVDFAKEIKPYQVTLVPERPEEVTTEGGLELRGRVKEIKKVVKELNAAGIKVSLFLNPEEKAMELARKVGAQIVEIHTGIYAEAETEEERLKELEKVELAARVAKDLGLIVHAGHGLSYENIGPIAAIPEIEEFSIGHSIISRAIFVGLKDAVREMKELILRARGG